MANQLRFYTRNPDMLPVATDNSEILKSYGALDVYPDPDFRQKIGVMDAAYSYYKKSGDNLLYATVKFDLNTGIRGRSSFALIKNAGATEWVGATNSSAETGDFTNAYGTALGLEYEEDTKGKKLQYIITFNGYYDKRK